MYKFKHIIVDVNNLFRRFYSYKNKEVCNNNFFKENNVYNKSIISILKHIQHLQETYLVDKGFMYFLFDNPESKNNIRYEIDSNYKKNRPKMEKNYYQALSLLKYILQNMNDNYFIFQVTYLEADDLVKPLLTNVIKDDNNYIMLYSEDLDWARCINKNIFWFNGKIIYNIENFKTKFGFTPLENNICLYKAIKGDASDNIPVAVHNINKKILYKILEETYVNISSFLTNIHFLSYLDEKTKNKFISCSNRLKLNYELVRFLDISYSEISQYFISCSLNINVLKRLYDGITDKYSNIDKRDIFNKSENIFFLSRER